MTLKKAVEAARILWGIPAKEGEDFARLFESILSAEPTITPQPLPTELMELTTDEANSGEYDDWLDAQAQEFCVEQEFPAKWHWER